MENKWEYGKQMGTWKTNENVRYKWKLGKQMGIWETKKNVENK